MIKNLLARVGAQKGTEKPWKPAMAGGNASGMIEIVPGFAPSAEEGAPVFEQYFYSQNLHAHRLVSASAADEAGRQLLLEAAYALSFCGRGPARPEFLKEHDGIVDIYFFQGPVRLDSVAREILDSLARRCGLDAAGGGRRRFLGGLAVGDRFIDRAVLLSSGRRPPDYNTLAILYEFVQNNAQY